MKLNRTIVFAALAIAGLGTSCGINDSVNASYHSGTLSEIAVQQRFVASVRENTSARFQMTLESDAHIIDVGTEVCDAIESGMTPHELYTGIVETIDGDDVSDPEFTAQWIVLARISMENLCPDSM